MRTSVPLALLSAFVVIGAGTARASEDAEGVPVPPATARGAWYGGTVLLFDGAMIATTAGCAALTDSEGCQLPVYGYLLGGPIIHGRHHGWGRALASVGLRLGLPLVGLFLGLGTGSSDAPAEATPEATDDPTDSPTDSPTDDATEGSTGSDTARYRSCSRRWR